MYTLEPKELQHLVESRMLTDQQRDALDELSRRAEQAGNLLRALASLFTDLEVAKDGKELFREAFAVLRKCRGVDVLAETQRQSLLVAIKEWAAGHTQKSKPTALEEEKN